jgi:Tfp pilus assembly protein PilO
MSAKISPKTLAIVLAGVCVLLAAGGWFGLVSSQRSKSTTLASQTADARTNLDVLNSEEQAALAAQKAAAKSGAKGKAKAKAKAETKANQAELLQVAFPSAVNMPSILLQVEKLADASGVSLDSFAPTAGTSQSGYDALPINVTVTGRYKGIQRFVHALRVQAGSSDGRVHASGRLFSVETVGITAATDGLPELSATIVLNAFVYSGVAPAAENADGSEAQTTTTSAEGTS